MAMTVKNFLELPITKDFTVLAGHNYLHRAMKNVEILDFEFLEGFEQTRETMFTEDSLVLTSLLFAKDRPELLVHMVKELVRFKVSALAFKAVIFDSLPIEVIELANQLKLPLLKFGGDEFFEDIIFQAMDYRNKTSQIEFIQTTIAHLIENNQTTEQLTPMLAQLNKPFEEYVQVLCLKSEAANVKSLFQLEPFLRDGLITTYKEYVIVVVTNKNEFADFEPIISRLVQLFEVKAKIFHMGTSEVMKTATAFHSALQQAYFCTLFAEIYDEGRLTFENLSTEKLLIQLVKNQKNYVMDYIENYIEPLEVGENNLLQTAIDYVLLKGNIKAVADKQFCHPNTIRYRLSKMRSLGKIQQTEFSYYEELSVAMKLYLLQKKLISIEPPL